MKLKKIHWIIIAIVGALIIFPSLQSKEGKKTADPTETIFGFVTDNGVPVSNANVKITLYTAATCHSATKPDYYTGSTNKKATDGRPIYMIQTQWQGCGDVDDGDMIIVEATYNGKKGKVATSTGMTPFEIDVALGQTIGCNVGTITNNYPDGKISSTETYVNCLKSGYQYGYYDTTSSAAKGVTSYKYYYTAGIMTGTQYTYWENGKTKSSESYSAIGLKHGYMYYYDSTGKQISREYWLNGIMKS